MQNDSDNIFLQYSLKKRLKYWRNVVIAILVIFTLILLYKPEGAYVPSVSSDYIGRVNIEGIILEDEKRDKKIINIATDKNAKGLIIYINSPGGTMIGGEHLYNTISKVAKEKPVVAVIGTIGTSGGYMAAIGADKILASKGSLTGSIGVILQTAEFTELSNKLGVKLETFKSSDLKGTPSPFEKVTDNAKKILQESIDDTYDIFKEMVKNSRNLTEDELNIVSDGRVFTGRDALENKLIDGIGTIPDAYNIIKKEAKLEKDVVIKEIDISPKESLIEEYITKSLGVDKLFSSQSNLTGILALWKM